MRNRPQRNRRRGLLRAAATVIGLVILLCIALLVVSSLSAPKAKAPVVPIAPKAPATVKPSRTAPPATVKPSRTTTPAAPRASATATHKSKKKTLGLGAAVSGLSLEHGPTHALLREALGARPTRISPSSVASRSRDGSTLAFFAPGNDPYRGSALYLRSDRSGPVVVGRGDPLVSPSLSAHGQLVAYVRAQPTIAFPGTRWSVVQYDRSTGHASRLGTWNAMGVTPLGWFKGGLLTLVANETNTTLFSLRSGHRRRLDTLMGQPIVTASLSPDGHSFAFGAPTNCYNCTLDLYDTAEQRVKSGPTGMPNETTLAWTRDSSKLVALVGHRLIAVDLAGGEQLSVPAPANLPQRWVHTMRASIAGKRITLIDTVTGARFQSVK